MRKCSHCRERRLYAEKVGWRGGVCGRCNEGYRKKALINRQAKIEGWRADATPVECTTCHEVKPYGRGWSIQVCPACTAVYSKAQHRAVQSDPERAAHRREKRREAAAKRRERAQGADSSPSSPAGDGQGG